MLHLHTDISLYEILASGLQIASVGLTVQKMSTYQTRTLFLTGLIVQITVSACFDAGQKQRFSPQGNRSEPC